MLALILASESTLKDHAIFKRASLENRHKRGIEREKELIGRLFEF